MRAMLMKARSADQGDLAGDGAVREQGTAQPKHARTVTVPYKLNSSVSTSWAMVTAARAARYLTANVVRCGT